MNAHSFPLDGRMNVVLFAGMGGACDGLEWAGFPVHVAINHDPVAVAVHEIRHPHTRHLRCDVFEADPRAVCGRRKVNVLHASPDCTHFSVAKGGKPVSPRRRSLAWIVCRWAGTVRPETITLENVREIQTWGPLVAKRDPATGRVVRLDGSVAAKGEVVPVREQWLVPDPRHRRRIWRAWLNHLRGLGYRHELDADDHRRLLDLLDGLSGMVVLSGYASPLYDDALNGWIRIETKALADGARPRTEVLWLNPACHDALTREAAQIEFFGRAAE
jgi:DNA (cytosine-5)-methyltransferase 1